MTSASDGHGPAWQASRQDAGPSTIMPADAVPVPAPFGPLAADMARLFRSLGLQSFRASVVETASMAYEAVWLMGENGEVTEEVDRSRMDSAFPGSNALVQRLANASFDETIDQPFGARRCVYAWRLDAAHVIIAEARYHERHDRTRELDIAAARLVCSAGLIGRQDEARLGATAPPLNWVRSPAADAPAPSRGTVLTGLGLSLAAAGLSAWLALTALPAVRDETQHITRHATQLRSMADDTLSHALTTALAGGDYGEVQNQLGSFETLGYFRGALITNARQRVVAIAGQVDDTLRIGIELPDGTVPKAAVRDLTQGAERFGRLVIVKPATTEPSLSDMAPLRTVAGVVSGAAALAALMMAWALRRRGGSAAG